MRLTLSLIFTIVLGLTRGAEAKGYEQNDAYDFVGALRPALQHVLTLALSRS
jgi:hypothetical protein